MSMSLNIVEQSLYALRNVVRQHFTGELASLYYSNVGFLIQ